MTNLKLKRIAVGPVGLCCAAVALSGMVAADPCYTNMNWQPSKNCQKIELLLPLGPCPWGPSIFNVPPTCGAMSWTVAIPGGTSGNEASGSMDQDHAQFTCKVTAICTKRIIGVSPIWPPVGNVACIPGTAFASAFDVVFGATGAKCPGGG